MELKLSISEELNPVSMEKIAAFIASIQKENGEIPWSEGGKTDPWDHVESAMGLSTGGFYAEARSAYEWLAGTQLPDGSWWSEILDGKIVNSSKEANFSSYVAVGVFHHYLITKDMKFLKTMWPTISQGIQYAIDLQAPEGGIYWARNKHGVIDKMALLTGSSSIYMSIKCALAIAGILGKKRPSWRKAMDALGMAIKTRPDLFNMIKSRYSMDWYYPVLCGAITGEDAKRRIAHLWEKFVVPEWGVRCVSDRPWVTMAETAEFILTLAAIGDIPRAKTIFSWLHDKRFSDGSFWMGVTFPDGVIWPEEKTGWTAAAAMMAWDALSEITPAGKLFNHKFWASWK
ncbi:MAG: phenyltransferase domain-containing protein [Smithella sp.]